MNDITVIKQKVTPILEAAGVQRASVFGSVARGEARPDSDIDVLVQIPRGFGLFKFVGLKQDLEHALHKKVDLVEFGALKSRIAETALKDQVEIYDSQSRSISR